MNTLIEPWWPRSVHPQATVGRPHEKFTGVTLKWNFLVIWFEPSVVLILGSWTSWQKTLFHKIGSTVDGNLTWSRPCMINLLTFSCLIVWLVACLLFNLCLLFGHFIIIAFMRVAKGCAKTESADIWVWLWCWWRKMIVCTLIWWWFGNVNPGWTS